MSNTTPTPSAILREQLAQKNEARPEVCIEDGDGAFIEFLPSPHLRVGYGTSQLLHYQLATRQPDLADDPTKQPQLLTLGFATADVIISGQRLEVVLRWTPKTGQGGWLNPKPTQSHVQETSSA